MRRRLKEKVICRQALQNETRQGEERVMILVGKRVGERTSGGRGRLEEAGS